MFASTFQKSTVSKILYALAAVGLIASGFAWYYRSTCDRVANYSPSRDRAFLLKLFDDNWDWLISSPDYNPEHTLDTSSPNHYEPQYFGQLILKVMVVDGKPVGLAAYYMRKFYLGSILFVAVDEQYRGKGYAQKLVNYAMKDLYARGAQKVELVTRTDNYRAQNLYQKIGFKEVGRDDTFVEYEIDTPKG